MTTANETIVDKVLWESDDGGRQLRFVVSVFRGVAYMHMREYYLSFDEGYVPSKDGVNIPVNITSMQALLTALAETLSDSEFRYILENALNENKKPI